MSPLSDQIFNENQQQQQQSTVEEEKADEIADEKFGKKKKKLKIKFDEIDEDAVETKEYERDTEGDKSYYELLTYIFQTIGRNNPDLVKNNENQKLVLKPPQIDRIGTRRTAISNFGEICSILRRDESHLYSFFMVELSTTGSLAMNKQLIVKGRFQQPQIEKVLKKYIRNNFLNICIKLYFYIDKYLNVLFN